MKTLKLIFFCILCLLICVTGCSNKMVSTDEIKDIQLQQGDTVKDVFTNSLLPGMKGIAENDNLQLYINDETAEIAVLDKRNGSIWRSNPADRDSDPIASGEKKDLLSAQLILAFNNEFGQLNHTNSYNDSVARNQIAFKLLPDGIKVYYQFGTMEKTLEDLPKYISKERFEEKILSKIDDRTLQRALRFAYREDKNDGVYVRNDGLSGALLNRTLNAFEIAGYTDEDLAYDLAEHGLAQTKPEPRLFLVSIEYILDHDSLVVKIPVNDIKYTKEYPIYEISVLSLFGAGEPDEEGALFVPDGSGALIYFNNEKAKYPPYRQDVYGRDLTVADAKVLAKGEKARMPVFGIIKESSNSALFGIIEEGASVAAINADVNGRENSYNYVYPSFYVVNKDDVTLQSEDKRREFPRYQQKPMKEDYVVRYTFLNGEDASCEGMARFYRQYLIQNNMLSEGSRAKNDNTPFYLELIGSISTRKHFIGVPYRALEPMTTFEQAKLIISEMKQKGIDNIKLKYSGWFNKGLYHKVPNSISVDGAVGGEKGLRDFLSYLEKEKITIYPDTALLRVYNTSGLSFNIITGAARRLTEVPAAVYPYDYALDQRDTSRLPSYVLSPRHVERYVSNMLKSLTGFGINAVSLRDLADELNSDYRKNRQIDRTESEKISISALVNIYQSGIDIMAKGGNSYSWPYITDITHIPLGKSSFKIEDEDIPFYQMVVRGFIEYTGAPYNLSVYTNYRQYILKCLEYGSNVHFTWSFETTEKVKDTDFDYLYSTYYKEWIEPARQIYHEVNDVLKQVSNQGIISHQKLEEGVYKTVYENGLYVIVNYNGTPVSVDGLNVGSQDFIVGGDNNDK